MRTIVLTLVALITAACGGGAAPGGTDSTLPPVEAPTTSLVENPAIDLAAMRAVACGDAVFYLVDPDGASLVTITIPELAARAHEASGPVTETFDVGGMGMTVTLQTGRHLDQLACNDALEAEPVIETEASATAGTVSVTSVAGDGGEFPIGETLASSELVVTGLAFGDATSSTEPVAFSDLLIGWYVG